MVTVQLTQNLKPRFLSTSKVLVTLNQTHHTHYLFETHLINLEDIMMKRTPSLDAKDRRFCDICWSSLPFAGFAILFLEHFLQILPVVWAADRLQIVSIRFKPSQRYPSFECLHLLETVQLQAFRKDSNATQDALKFPDYLLNLGKEKLQSKEKQAIQLLASVKLLRDPKDMIEKVFSDL